MARGGQQFGLEFRVKSQQKASIAMHESQRGQRRGRSTEARRRMCHVAMTPDRERTVWDVERGVVSWWSHKHKRDG